MLTEVKNHLGLIGRYFQFNLAASMEYRGSFLLQVFGMFANNLSFIFIWWVFFTKANKIGGYSFRDVAFIWALAAVAFGLVHIFFGNVRNLGRMIMNGELDAYLLQPKDAYINMLSSQTIVSAWGDLCYGFILYCLVFGMQPLPLLLFTGFGIAGGLLMGSVMAMAGILTFYLGNASTLERLVTDFLLTFTLYPEGIFKGPARWIIYSLLPAGFIVFLPLKIYQFFNIKSLAFLLLMDLFYIIFVYWLFQKGLKRYESGNLITVKM